MEAKAMRLIDNTLYIRLMALAKKISEKQNIQTQNDRCNDEKQNILLSNSVAVLKHLRKR